LKHYHNVVVVVVVVLVYGLIVPDSTLDGFTVTQCRGFTLLHKRHLRSTLENQTLVKLTY